MDEEAHDWVDFATQSGEVQTKLQFPKGVNGMAQTYAGNQEWIWTANFEAFDSFPAGIGSTPEGDYRFVVNGLIRQNDEDVAYTLNSDQFHVSPWNGIKVEDLRLENDGSVSFTVDGTYPELDEGAAFPYVKMHMRNEADRGELRPEDIRTWCDTCSFRAWARQGEILWAVVHVERADGSIEYVVAELHDDGRYYAPTDLHLGDEAVVPYGGVFDSYHETNSVISNFVMGTNPIPDV
jgi:hypothetical protein